VAGGDRTKRLRDLIYSQLGLRAADYANGTDVFPKEDLLRYLGEFGNSLVGIDALPDEVLLALSKTASVGARYSGTTNRNRFLVPTDLSRPVSGSVQWLKDGTLGNDYQDGTAQTWQPMHPAQSTRAIGWNPVLQGYDPEGYAKFTIWQGLVWVFPNGHPFTRGGHTWALKNDGTGVNMDYIQRPPTPTELVDPIWAEEFDSLAVDWGVARFQLRDSDSVLYQLAYDRLEAAFERLGGRLEVRGGGLFVGART